MSSSKSSQLQERYNVSQIIIFGFKPDRNGKLNTQATYTQMRNVVKIIRNYSGKVKIDIESCYSPMLAVLGESPVFGNVNFGANKGCLAGISRFSISVDGLLSPCRHLDICEKYNTLEDYWNCSETLQEIRILHKTRANPCSDCYYSKY